MCSHEEEEEAEEQAALQEQAAQALQEEEAEEQAALQEQAAQALQEEEAEEQAAQALLFIAGGGVCFNASCLKLRAASRVGSRCAFHCFSLQS